ncbi:MAG: hypothetical protein AAF222_02055 [Pseudomonadota bacterium]
MSTFARLVGSLSLIAMIAGCARPLTTEEREFADDLFGPSLDTSKVRVAEGLGVIPQSKTIPGEVRLVEGTDQACLRTPQPRGAQPPQAFAVFNRLHFETGLYSSDMVLAWPESLCVPQAIIFAHELVHAWQWQNRAETGYHPLRALGEYFRFADPYFSDGQSEFFNYGYEQQAAIVEDYVCFAMANPNHPRRGELRTILAPVFPVDAFDAALGL